MDKFRLLVLLFISSNFCSGQTLHSNINETIFTDTTAIIFNDSSYRLTVHVFDNTNYDEEKSNAVLIFTRQEKNKTKILFRDSLYCIQPFIDFQDFNNDKVKDVLVFHSTGARANPTYHLYLTDKKNRKLIRIKGFEKLPNPSLDATNNIIASVGLSGTNYYSFYRIDFKNRLINLRHSYEENPGDSTQYEKTIQNILRSHK